MANECVPYWDPSGEVTVVPTVGGCVGRRFVATVGPLNALFGTDGGMITGVIPAAGQPILGVASQDSPAGVSVTVYTHGLVPVTAGGNLTASTFVQTDATGAAIPWDGTVGSAKAGLCVADTLSGFSAPILLLA